MSYRIRLFLTHIATAIAAGCCVWCGQQVDGFSQLAFVVLFGASIVIPHTIAARWLACGLRKMESALVNAGSTAESSGLQELDEVASRLRTVFERQRALVQNVDDLVMRLGHASVGARESSLGDVGQLLTDALGRLSRTSACDVGRIMSMGDDIAKGAHDTRGAAQEQVRTVENAVSSIEMLAGGIDTSGQDAEAVNEAAKDIREHAAMGLDLIQQLVRGMEDIRSNVEYSEKKVTALGQQSERIGSIVETMGNISARTDMLALNASIEAVRAGQEGRGFAVVADEVRKLAESTATASRDIAELVNAIQSEAIDTVSLMTEERQQVQEEIRRVNEAGTTLEEIGRSSVSAANRSRQIAQSTIEQLQRTQDVVRAMQQLSTIAGRIDERSELIRHKTTDLAEAAQSLEEGLSPMYHYGDSDSHSVARRISTSLNVSARDQAIQPGDELLQAVSGGEFAK